MNILQIIHQSTNYCEIFDSIETIESTVTIPDHLNGFDQNLHNEILSRLNSYASNINKMYNVILTIPLQPNVKRQYSNLCISWKNSNWLFDTFREYHSHPELNFKNFVCSFNGFAHVGRKLLVAILYKFGYFDPAYSSKNFSFTTDTLDGHIYDYVGPRQHFYNKFFIADTSSDFFEKNYSFGYNKFLYQHEKNIYNLESKITQSFIHLVSETMATSYHPFVTEKFLYSVVTRGLFIAYAQPGWHNHVEEYFGFKKYSQLFDYQFDTIVDPVSRLVELVTMISKFSHLTPLEWHSLYQLERDTIEYNYNHYHSGQYLKHLSKFTQS